MCGDTFPVLVLHLDSSCGCAGIVHIFILCSTKDPPRMFSFKKVPS